MNKIEKVNQINFAGLDQEQYFQALLQEVSARKLVFHERLEGIQLELIELLGKEVERYTNGESSSIPVDKAQQILYSVTYCIGLYLKAYSDQEEVLSLLRTGKVAVLFYQGMEAAAAQKAEAELLLNSLKKKRLTLEHIAYQDTISEGIGQFFHDYDIEYGAHEMPCDIDYPLCVPVTNLIGVEYIREYLHRLTLENDFLGLFDQQKLSGLLHGFHKDYRHMLINIFELALTNILGCKLLELDLYGLDIPAKECDWLQEHLLPLGREELLYRLEAAMKELGKELKLEAETLVYASHLLPELADRIRNNLKTESLREIFLSFRDEEEGEVFIDGMPMQDESLRELLKTLGKIKLVSEKMAIIKETVRSFADLEELLEECFYGKEYEEVFSLLSENDIKILKNRVMEEAGPEAEQEYIPDKEWQKILLYLYPVQ